MPSSPRDSYAQRQGAEPKKSSRPDPKVVHASSPQLFRCPRCSALSFRILFRDRDVAGICAECDLQLRTDRRIGRATREYYADFNRQVGAGDSERVERIFLKMNSVSEAKRVYPVVRRLGYRTKQSSPMLHGRLVMVETSILKVAEQLFVFGVPWIHFRQLGRSESLSEHTPGRPPRRPWMLLEL